LIPDPNNEDNSILLMDTEGFSNIEESLDVEQKIALLALLLSSMLIYNVAGQIDEYLFKISVLFLII